MRGDLADAEVCIMPAMDVDQHMRQTEGWQESWDAIKAGMDLHGPFDGIMGFSQVCRPALAQSISFEGRPHGPCAGLLVRQNEAQESPDDQRCGPQLSDCAREHEMNVQGAAIAAAVCASQQTTGRAGQPQERCSQDGCLRFAVCCSGYPSPVQEHRQQQKTLHSLRLPSLHIYGGRDEDRQIAALESRALAEQYDVTQRHVIEHSSGHIIPSSKAIVNQIRDFLTKHVPVPMGHSS